MEVQWFEDLRADLRQSVRQMRSAPGFSLVAALTLALGIGANSAMFALVDTTLLKPLPFHEQDRLVTLTEQRDDGARSAVAPLNMLDWLEHSRSFEGIAGYVPNVGGMVMNGADGTAETVSRQWVTHGFFDVLAVRALIGRVFLPSDDQARSNVFVLSESFWRSRFNADPSIAGRTVTLDGIPYTAVGVVPDTSQLVGRTSIWAMVPLSVRRPQMRTAYSLGAIGRLDAGVTLDAAQSDLDGVARALAQEFPATNTGRGVVLEPLADALIGADLRLTSMLFLGVVGFVLLICCANVANLLLARATIRTRELTMRSALGATRTRIIKQLITESLVLSAIGGLLGLAVGAAILRVAPSMIPTGLLPNAITLTFDWRVAAFSAAAALLVGLIFSIAPAWYAASLPARSALATDSRTVTGTGGRGRSVLVIAEIATAVLLLVGAGLLLRTLIAIETVDRGYRADSALTMTIDPLGSRYPTQASLRQFYDAVEREVKAIPGVRSIAWSSALPLRPGDSSASSFEIAGGPVLDDRTRPAAKLQIVSPGYFDALDLPIVSGRAFTDADTSDTVAVCIVSDAFVRGHLQGRSPIGVRIATRPATAPNANPVIREIVGVARQVKERPDEPGDTVQIYVPMLQNLVDDIYMVVRPTSGNAEALTNSVRAAIGRVDTEQLVSVRDVMTLEEVAWQASARHRFRAVMVLTFAAVALLLAIVGVFGLLAYAVQQRMRDLAVRRALGATSGDVFRLVIAGTARVVGIGAVIGLLMAAVLTRLLTTMLFGVEPLDPATFAGVIGVLLATAGLALAAPARRAARVDPAIVLRNQ